MSAEFISVSFPNASNDLNPIPDAPVDPRFLERYARALDDYGFNYTLIPYSSSSFDPFTLGATVLAHTKHIKIIVALRPNTVYPTVAAKSLATLDQLSGGRVVVHFIAGGSDEEQAREGDFLDKEERYERQEEYIRILRLAWTSKEPFDFDGKYYQFKQFRSAVRPTNGLIPISVGGSSDAAYRIGVRWATFSGSGASLLQKQSSRSNGYTRKQQGQAGRIALAYGLPSGRSSRKLTSWHGKRRIEFSTS